MATPLAGVYLAGVIASGNDANRLFIENARGHGELDRAGPARTAAGADALGVRVYRCDPLVPPLHHLRRKP